MMRRGSLSSARATSAGVSSFNRRGLRTAGSGVAISSGEALREARDERAAAGGRGDAGAWERDERRRSLRWAAAAGAALVAAALWLREPSLAYLVACVAATAVAVALLPRWVRGARRAHGP